MSKALYDQLSGIDLGSKDDNYFRGLGFEKGRQGALDFMGQARNQYDPMTISKNVRNEQIAANQPAINTLQTTKSSLEGKYDELLKSIKGDQTTAENRQTLTTGNELARRGLSNDSGLYEQSMTDAVNPVTRSFAGLTAQTGEAKVKDLGQIALQIANLQAGNPDNAFSVGSNFANQATQASQFAQDLELRRAAQALAERTASSGKQDQKYEVLGEGETLFDLLNNKPLYTAGKTRAPSSGSQERDF